MLSGVSEGKKHYLENYIILNSGMSAHPKIDR